MAGRGHHSIGEVLSLLKDDFPDITISKIRFLESQGLIDPERTRSGYRKFYDGDIERLRWILTQQRDSFLPLKVIKRRLEDNGFEPVVRDTSGPLPTAAADTPPASLGNGAAKPPPQPSLFAKRETDESAVTTDPGANQPPPEAPTASVPSKSIAKPSPAAQTSPERAPSVVASDPKSTPASSIRAEAQPADDPLTSATVSAALSIEELSGASGLPVDKLAELENLGLITGRKSVGGPTYDDEAVVVAAAAAAFIKHGLEPRHLRMYKISADREAGVIEQLVKPYVQRADRDSITKARADASELIRLGEVIHRSLLRQSLGRELS